MSIPLDRLYNHLDSIVDDDIIIYRFSPHGSKKLSDLTLLTDKGQHREWIDRITARYMIMHDQEPLDFDLYKNGIDKNQIRPYENLINNEYYITMLRNMGLRSIINNPMNVHDSVLLCHSEKNSKELEKYESTGFVGVYWWSHAVISRDWYRYAEHDLKLVPDFNSISYDFLIYNRAWSHTREYRLYFTEQLINNNLHLCSNVKFNPDDQGHYTSHQFKNTSLQISRHDIEKHITKNNSTSCSSADYSSDDYFRSAVEVVLETLFDDSRNHLTEKILRPIACGRPFVLVSTPGSLEYLKEYGFETFSNVINETYDTITDSKQRILAIIAEMKRISTLPADQKNKLWTELYKIAKRNQQHFFSDYFHDLVIQEFKNNIHTGGKKVQTGSIGKYWNHGYANQLVQKMFAEVVPNWPDQYQKLQQWLLSKQQ